MANEFVARNGVIAQNNSVITGSLVVTNGITGSMFGTSSQALTSSYSQTASYIQNAQTASYVLNAISSSFATSASYAISSSATLQAQTASYILNAVSASYALSSSYAISSSAALQANTASYVLQAVSASFATSALTASFGGNFTASNALINGTLTAQTLVVQTITSSIEYSSGSNIFGSSLTNTQQLTGSTSMTGSLTVYGNTVMTGSLNVSGSITTTGALAGTSASFSSTIIGATVLGVGNSGTTVTNGTGFGGVNQVNVGKFTSNNYTALEINSTNGTTGASLQFTYGTNTPNNVSGIIGYNGLNGTPATFSFQNKISGGDLEFVVNGNSTPSLTIASTGAATFSSSVTSNGFIKSHIATDVNIVMGSYSGAAGLQAYNDAVSAYISMNFAASSYAFNVGAATFASSVTATSFIGAGTGLTGTANSLVVGNSLALGGYTWSGSHYTTPGLILTFNTGGTALGYSNASDIQSYLGLGSNAYTSTAYVPYTGATGAVNLGTNSISAGTGSKISGTIASGNGLMTFADGSRSAATAQNYISFTDNTATRMGYIGATGDGNIHLGTDASRAILLEGGSVTLGTTSGTGTGAFYAGAATFSGTVVANSSAFNYIGLQLIAASGYPSNLNFYRAGYSNWYMGSPNASTAFYIGQDGGFSTYALSFSSTNAATFSSSVTATSLIKSGGTSSQFLMADGSVNTSVLPSGAYLPLSAGGGNSLSGNLFINFSNPSANNYINVINTASTGYAQINLVASSSGTSGTGSINYIRGAYLNLNTSDATPITLSTNNTTALTINGSTQAITLAGALSGTSASFSSTTASTSYTTGALVVSGGVGVAGAIFSNSTINAAGGFFETSDERLKKVIKRYATNHGFAAVDFIWKKTGVEDFGYIAQEVEKVIPFAVHTRVDGFKEVNYNKANLYKIMRLEDCIIKEHATIHKRIDELEAELKTLKERLK